MQSETIVCIIAAAGRGVRFGRDLPKSFHPVEGSTLLVRSIRSLDAWGGIARYVVMVPPGWEERAREEIARELPRLACEVFPGGESRQESVSMGLAAVGAADILIVHDACRPIVSTALIGRVVDAARGHGAAVPALEATDTLGRLRDEAIEAIVPRERVVGIQTPQAFAIGILRAAFDAADETIRYSTDESSLVLAAGFPVRAVEGERWNIKVTVKEDLEIVASFLAGKRLELPRAED
jgi:2-C-methyl-D-erythritol 4-phosphate cytidylyltransferase/2-C-methyl-D-erythritol 2,4-cyclodiphosphate synthase